MTATYEAGDVVVLRSGGPNLTVTGLADGVLQVIWYAEEAEDFRKAELPASAVVLVETADEFEDEDEGEEDEDEADDADED